MKWWAEREIELLLHFLGNHESMRWEKFFHAILLVAPPNNYFLSTNIWILIKACFWKQQIQIIRYLWKNWSRIELYKNIAKAKKIKSWKIKKFVIKARLANVEYYGRIFSFVFICLFVLRIRSWYSEKNELWFDEKYIENKIRLWLTMC